jgi:propanol-preferring alcohol dehydrogenase
MEREIKSVANITAQDIREFLAIAAAAGIRPEIETYSLSDANRALIDLKTKPVRGAKVLLIENPDKSSHLQMAPSPD